MFDYFRALDGLADEEREIHATVRAFVDEAIVPHVQGWWDTDTLPRELMTQMGELGILGPTTPAEYGAFIKKEQERWSKVVRAAGIRAD